MNATMPQLNMARLQLIPTSNKFWGLACSLGIAAWCLESLPWLLLRSLAGHGLPGWPSSALREKCHELNSNFVNFSIALGVRTSKFSSWRPYRIRPGHIISFFALIMKVKTYSDKVTGSRTQTNSWSHNFVAQMKLCAMIWDICKIKWN